MNRLLVHSHNGCFSCGTRKKLSARSCCCLRCLAVSTGKMQWLCSTYPLLLMGLLVYFLKAPLQAGGYKAEAGPPHPPEKHHTCPTSQQNQGASAWSTGLRSHSPMQEVLALL